MQHSGLSSDTAELDADRLSLWELVWRSACGRSHHTAGQLWVKQLSVKWVISAGQIIFDMQHLDKNVFHNLIAVIMHTYVTGEGLTEENVSV